MLKKLMPVLKVFKRSSQVCTIPVPPTVPPCFWSMLPNGVRVITETTSSPFTCVSMFVEAGPRYETACNNGITHFIEHMAYKGYRMVRKTTFEEQIYLQGIQMTTKTCREFQVFTATCTAESFYTVLESLSRIVNDIGADDYEVQCAKYVVEQEMVDADNNPKKVMFDYLHESAFQGTPLAQRVIGPSKNIDSFDRCFVRTYVKEHYQPYRLILCVSSMYKHEEVVYAIQQYFGSMEAAPSFEEIWPARYTGSSIVYRDDSLPQLHFAIAVETPGYTSLEYHQLHLLKHILGRWDQSVGGGYKTWPALAQASSVSQLCYSYKAFYFPYRDVGLLGVYCVTNTMDADDLVYNIHNNFMYMCTMMNDSDLQRAVNSYKMEVMRNMSGAVNACWDMGEQMVFNCKRTSLEEILHHLDCLKVLELKKLAEKYLYDRCPVVAAVGPTEGMPDYLRVRSGMYWLRL